MTRDSAFHIALDGDLHSLAALRWRLKAGDDAPLEGEAFAQFAEEFTRFERAHRAPGETVHWLAEVAGEPAAAMSVVIVRKVASPDGGDRRWGYLTNCYVVPEHRNAGLGRRLLEAVQSWARDQAFEFLIVWPSERAFSFYERSGFQRAADVLVWTPD